MKKAILFICDHLHGGGAERINLDLAEQYIKDGFEVYMALLDASNIGMELPFGLNVIDLDIHLHNGNLRKRGKVLNRWKKIYIERVVDSIKPSLILVSYYYAYWLLPFLGNGNVWCWIHSNFTWFNARERARNRNIISYLNEVRRVNIEKKVFSLLFDKKNLIFVNAGLKNLYEEYCNLGEVKVIENGIKIERLLGYDARKENPIFDAIYVGRLADEKQPEVAIKAFAKSKLKGKLAIIGDGYKKDKLLSLTKELNVVDRVEFLGWQKKPEQFICKSRMLLLTSRTEGLPLVVSEALLLNVPVVAFNCSSGVEYQLNSELLRRGLVESNNLNELVIKINEIYDDPYDISDDDKARLGMDVMYKKFKALLTE